LRRSGSGPTGAPVTATLTFEVIVPRTRFLASFALVAVTLLAACDTRVVTEPEFQPQVINLRNDFAFQISGLADFTNDVVYTWTSDGTAASVTQMPTVLTGTATLFILDGAGAQVYQRSLGENGSFTTTAGVPGNWTLHVKFQEASGSASFRVTKQ
jgi:hypothetical protein